MRKLIIFCIKTSIISVFVISFPVTSLLAQGIESHLTNASYITGIDMGVLAKECLPGWRLIREKIKWTFGREYLYTSSDSSSLVCITLGVHASQKRSIEIAHEYMNDVSIYFEKGSRYSPLLGDSAWYGLSGTDPAKANHIMFVRKNALITIGGVQNMNGVFEIAKRIDEGILRQQAFVRFDTLFSPPEIHSIGFSVKDVNKLNTYSTVIDATDYSKTGLDYQFAPGTRMVKTEKSNEFICHTNPTQADIIKGFQSIRAIAVNKNNVVSEIKEYKLNVQKK